MIKEDEIIDDLQLNGLNIIQKENRFKFGVDAVLLSDFANIRKHHEVIDLCTGTGIVPLLALGKYSPKRIVGVEVQEEMAEMAQRSMELNNCQDIISIINCDLNDKAKIKEQGRFDVVTVNPPYKINNAGIKNPNDALAIARHEILCTLEDVIRVSRDLLKDNGRIYMVHRPERLIDIFLLMRKYKIEPKRVRMIHPKYHKAANIVLVEGQRDGKPFLKWDDPLYVYKEDGTYSDEIDKIYGRI